MQLELVAMRHARFLEEFEIANRGFFAERVGDRGDDYFARFEERLAALVDENDVGRSLLFVIVDNFGRILGRVNITDIDQPDLTELGFRVAEADQGRGVATYGVSAALEAARECGVDKVLARVAEDNLGSRRVLARVGFTETGRAESPVGSDARFLGFEITL